MLACLWFENTNYLNLTGFGSPLLSNQSTCYASVILYSITQIQEGYTGNLGLLGLLLLLSCVFHRNISKQQNIYLRFVPRLFCSKKKMQSQYQFDVGKTKSYKHCLAATKLKIMLKASVKYRHYLFKIHICKPYSSEKHWLNTNGQVFISSLIVIKTVLIPSCHVGIKTNTAVVKEAQKMPERIWQGKLLKDLQKVLNNTGLPLYCGAQAWPSLNILKSNFMRSSS